MNKLVVASSLSILMATVAFAMSHPDLKNAYDLADQSIKQIQGAQKTENTGGANFGGHTAKAIDLLTQAKKELAAADEYNDAHQKKPK